MNPAEELMSLIESLELSPEDKRLWQECIDLLPNGEPEKLLKIIQAAPNLLLQLMENLKRKKQALLSGDDAAMEKILEEEEKLYDLYR